MVKKDRRKINGTWTQRGRGANKNTFFVFGRLGSGKNETIITLGHGSTREIARKRARKKIRRMENR